MLILDLFVFHKKAHTVSNKEALGFTLFWIALAMVFSGVFYFEYGFEAFSQFQAAYWIEKALSVENLFVLFWFLAFLRFLRDINTKSSFMGYFEQSSSVQSLFLLE